MDKVEKQVEETLEKETKETPPTEEETKGAEKETPEESEFDLGDDRKVKKSQVLDWEKGYLRQEDYTKKTQELTQQREELKELVEYAGFLKKNPKIAEAVIGLTEKGVENPEMVVKVLEVISGKIEKAKEEIEEEIEGLDPDDPMAKMLKKTLKSINALDKKVDSIERGNIRTREENSAKEENVLVEKAHKVLTGTMGEITKSYEFISDKEKNIWQGLVLSYLKDHPKNYKDEQDFVDTIKKTGETYYKALKDLGEEKLKKYLKSKEKPASAGPGATGSPLSKKPDMDNLQDILEEELNKIDKGE